MDLHHIQHWVNGGPTDLANLISLCPWHHKLVHDRGYLIAALPAGSDTFAFYRPDGSLLPSSPPLPEPESPIDQTHDAEITPDTIIPPWYGERLDLNHAIWACFANARTDEENKPTGSRPKSRSSDRTHGAVTSATRPTTSAVFTTNIRPPDSPALYACFAIFPTLEDGTE